MEIYSDVSMTATGLRLVRFVDKHYPASSEIYVTSSLRSEPGSHHSGNLFWNGSPTIAVDFGAYDDPEANDKDQADMRDFSDWWETHFYDLTAELIHTTPYDTDDGYYVVRGVRVSTFGAGTNAAHINHIHVAVSEASMTAIEKRAELWGWNGIPQSASGDFCAPNMVG